MNGVKSGGIQPYGLCVINVYGLEMVASASLYFTCASLAPFLAIIAVGLPQVDFNALTQAGLPSLTLLPGNNVKVPPAK